MGLRLTRKSSVSLSFGSYMTSLWVCLDSIYLCSDFLLGSTLLSYWLKQLYSSTNKSKTYTGGYPTSIVTHTKVGWAFCLFYCSFTLSSLYRFIPFYIITHALFYSTYPCLLKSLYFPKWVFTSFLATTYTHPFKVRLVASCGYMPKSGIRGSWGRFIFFVFVFVLRNLHADFQRGLYHLAFPPAIQEFSLYSTSSG